MLSLTFQDLGGETGDELFGTFIETLECSVECQAKLCSMSRRGRGGWDRMKRWPRTEGYDYNKQVKSVKAMR